MLKLYKVTFFLRRDLHTLQAVHASAPTKRDAVRRARAFVESHYPERIVLESAEPICRTPDDVLDWS